VLPGYQLASRRLPLLLLLPACLPACRAADTSCLKILQLNDLAGTVAGPLVDGRHKVSLDAGGKLVNAKAASLRPRPPPPSSGAVSTTEPAAVHDAHCREDEGRLFHLVLDLTRFYANERVGLSNISDPAELASLRGSAQGMGTLRKLAGASWTYWMPHPDHDFPGVRNRVMQHGNLQQQLKASIFHGWLFLLWISDERMSQTTQRVGPSPRWKTWISPRRCQSKCLRSLHRCDLSTVPPPCFPLVLEWGFSVGFSLDLDGKLRLMVIGHRV
jgi:hypothetical protein